MKTQTMKVRHEDPDDESQTEDFMTMKVIIWVFMTDFQVWVFMPDFHRLGLHV